jgi:hypothetical protein
LEVIAVNRLGEMRAVKPAASERATSSSIPWCASKLRWIAIAFAKACSRTISTARPMSESASHGFGAQAQLALCDTIEVEQVVDQERFQGDVAFHHRRRSSRASAGKALVFTDRRAVIKTGVSGVRSANQVERSYRFDSWSY